MSRHSARASAAADVTAAGDDRQRESAPDDAGAGAGSGAVALAVARDSRRGTGVSYAVVVLRCGIWRAGESRRSRHRWTGRACQAGRACFRRGTSLCRRP